MLPSADRATSASAASSIVTFSRRRSCGADRESRQRQRLQLEDLRARLDGRRHRVQISVVAIMNLTYGGGSSIDFSSASNACFESRWTSSMMKILKRSRIGAMPRRLDDDLADRVDAGVAWRRRSRGRPCRGLRRSRCRRRTRRTDRRVGPFTQFSAARQNARGGRLAHAARPRKDEGLREPPGRDGVLQRLDDAALADDVFEPLRTPLAGENLIGQTRQVRSKKSEGRMKKKGRKFILLSSFCLSSRFSARAPPRPGRTCGTCQDLT